MNTDGVRDLRYRLDDSIPFPGGNVFDSFCCRIFAAGYISLHKSSFAWTPSSYL